MNSEEYHSIVSEITELKSLLAAIPQKKVIARKGLEYRLREAEAAISGFVPMEQPKKARLTFRGNPVDGSRGIVADFATKAVGYFTDAFSAIVAENLCYMGPIPDKQKNSLLITGTAIGSFGFEFELPQPGPPDDERQLQLVLGTSRTEDAMQKLEGLFQAAAEGSDDEVAELVDQVHPRAVKKVAEFLNYVAEHSAWCGLEFKERFFRFDGVEQIKLSAERLGSENIKEFERSLLGEIQGVLPTARTFEFQAHGQEGVIKGKVGSGIEDADQLNRDYLHKLVNVKFSIIQFGQGRPRYTIEKLEDIALGGNQLENG